MKLYEMALYGTSSRAHVITEADSVTLAIGVPGNIPLVHKFLEYSIKLIKNGSFIIMDENGGTFTINDIKES